MPEVNFELQALAEQERLTVVDADYDSYMDDMYARFCADRDEWYETYDLIGDY